VTASVYLPFVRSLRDAVREAALITPSDTPPETPSVTPLDTECRPPEIEPERADVLLFSPHPDDEALVGGLPLRLAREAGLNVVNVAVTLGSRVEERAARLLEAQRSCALLGFGLIHTRPEGFSAVNLTARHDNPEHWADMVQCVRRILQEHRPACIFLPHAGDWHSTHLGTHWLVKDALQVLAANGEAFSGLIFETEYWSTNPAPNLMVESSPEDTALLVAAAARHASQVGRNPYHLRLPAFMLDNVRRGGELISGQYAAAPAMGFATLYKVSRWKNNTLHATPVRPALRAADRLTRSLASMLSG
jgi:N-acetylglucosamine malate deacetylase 1